MNLKQLATAVASFTPTIATMLGGPLLRDRRQRARAPSGSKRAQALTRSPPSFNPAR